MQFRQDSAALYKSQHEIYHLQHPELRNAISCWWLKLVSDVMMKCMLVGVFTGVISHPRLAC